MRDLRRLLLALDLHRDGRTLTAGSCTAADQALELATHLDGSEVLLLHSTADDESWDEGERTYQNVPEAPPEARRPVIEEVADRFRAAGVSASVASTSESPWLGIVRTVLRERIDLVVAGKRSEHHHGGHILGSVSMKLLRKCPCAVWVAKPGGHVALRRVLAASDLSPVGERAVGYAAWLASHFHAALHVVHTYQIPLAVQMDTEESVAEFDRRETEERTRQLEAQVSKTPGATSVSFHVARTSPTRAILECTEHVDPDLVVMGTISRGGIAGFLVGNTAERVLPRLDVSLLTVKPDDFVCPVSLEG
jgi:universal stress protein E